jgi:serine/threonine-protein kinase
MALVPQAGLVIAARYRLVRKVGAGGMGDVWAAEDSEGARVVALKLVRGGAGDDAAARVALLREARAAQALRHPHVLGIQEVLDVEGQPVLVMDLLHGETLAARLRRAPPLTVADVVALALPVTSALGAAHAAGLVHRDLKPENIFLVSADGGSPLVRVLDFGIARRSVIDSETAMSTGLTTTGLIVGTPAYMSPEQLYGERDLDHRADLWSLGVVVYQCLTGILPTEGDNLGQVIKAIVARPFEPLERLRPEVPPALANLVARLLSRDRTRRPFDASEVFDVLREIDPSAAEKIPRPPPLPARPTPAALATSQRRSLVRRPGTWVAALVALAAIALGMRWLRGGASPFVAGSAQIVACPPWRLAAPSADQRWLGVAAAATACRRGPSMGRIRIRSRRPALAMPR